jgi:hypothetical protein
MRRVLVFMLALGTLALFSSALATQASAATTIPVSMTFTEPILQNINSGCPAFGTPNGGFCGNGNFLPYGHATEMIVIGAGTPEIDVRTVTVANGSIVLHEIASNFTCPGVCGSPEFPGGPFSATLTDVVVSGTGIFAGASGNLSGTVKGTGLQSNIKLSGSITLAT